jgi:opacity protein-like surface antigen
VIGTTLAKIVARYPVGNLAPYVSFGGGVTYGGGYASGIKFSTPIKKFNFLDDTKFAWSPAVGVEYAITNNIRILAEGDWLDLGPKKNSIGVRTGIGFAF